MNYNLNNVYRLLHESENNMVTIELKSGELYRGYLTEAEVNIMNIFLILNLKL